MTKIENGSEGQEPQVATSHTLDGKEMSLLQAKLTPPVAKYLDGIKNLGLIARVIVGVDNDDCEAHVFNVFNKDTDPTEATDHTYADLTRLGGVMERKLRPDVVVRMGYVNPSDVPELESQCQELNIKLVPFELGQ